MTAFKSDFLNVLRNRGFIHQISDPDSLDALAARNELVAYIGFDCTAPSLHVGSMVQIMCLYWLQQTGNKPIALMGGGTTRVGDPSGKDETRKILSIEDIEQNKEGIKQVFSRFLSFGDGKHDAIMPDNAEWLTKLNWIEMLRDIGRHFSVNRMLAMDSVKLRLERDQEMSFIEFNYMILQAYDYAVLNQRYDCRLQMGGSDQWGNIVNGIDLGRRMGAPQLHALTSRRERMTVLWPSGQFPVRAAADVAVPGLAGRLRRGGGSPPGGSSPRVSVDLRAIRQKIGIARNEAAEMPGHDAGVNVVAAAARISDQHRDSLAAKEISNRLAVNRAARQTGESDAEHKP